MFIFLNIFTFYFASIVEQPVTLTDYLDQGAQGMFLSYNLLDNQPITEHFRYFNFLPGKAAAGVIIYAVFSTSFLSSASSYDRIVFIL